MIVASVHPNQAKMLHYVHFPGQNPLLYYSNIVATIHTEHSNETHDMKFPGQSPSNVFRKCCDAVVLSVVTGVV